MPFQRYLRLAAAAAALTGVVGFGLADWSGSTAGGYVVRPGDSLWAIAHSHRLTVTQLAAANGLDPNDILPIGRHLRLPSAGATLTAARSGPAPGSNPWTFCANFQATPGPAGVLPSQLAGTATYYRLAPIFQRWASHYNVSLPLLEAVAWQESGWQQNVVSPTGAVGVGQIEPYTATFISDYLVGQPLDPASVSDNVRLSAAFIRYLAGVEGDTRCATIAAYYEGPLNLQADGVLPDAQQYVADVEALEPRFG
jgi:hypothetical protein